MKQRTEAAPPHQPKHTCQAPLGAHVEPPAGGRKRDARNVGLAVLATHIQHLMPGKGGGWEACVSSRLEGWKGDNREQALNRSLLCPARRIHMQLSMSSS